MIATRTGVAPYRGYLRRMFMESVPKYRFNGLAWLFLGVANSDSLLHNDEFSKYLQESKRTRMEGRCMFRIKWKNIVMKYLNCWMKGHIFIFCGLKGMMPGIPDTLERVGEGRGESWEAKLSQLKKNKKWHVEVY